MRWLPSSTHLYTVQHSKCYIIIIFKRTSQRGNKSPVSNLRQDKKVISPEPCRNLDKAESVCEFLNQASSDQAESSFNSFENSRMLMLRVRHPALRWHGILSGSSLLLLLLLLHVRLVVHRLFMRHAIARRHRCRVARHAGLWCHLRMCAFFGRLDGRIAVDAILVAGDRFGSVKTCLKNGISRVGSGRRGGQIHTWMRFFPSGLVTSGCSFGVVKV